MAAPGPSSAPATSVVHDEHDATSPQGADEALGTLSAPGELYDDGAPQLIEDRDQLPPMHASAFKGDLAAVLACITNGESVNEVIMMPNQRGSIVCGITPLFLAAQRGHMKVVRLLVENGANPNQPSYIQGSTDLCTPAEVAKLNFHFMVARYLKKAAAKRREEDRVLAEDEAPAPPQRARSAHTAGRAAAGPPGPGAFMANLGDLSGWDPKAGAPPPQMGGSLVAALLRKNKVDLATWRPDTERTADGRAQLATSVSRVVSPDELGPDVEDHTRVISRYLADLDLSEWNPESGPAIPRSNPNSRRGSRAGTQNGAVTPTHAQLAALGADQPTPSVVISARDSSGGGAAPPASAPAAAASALMPPRVVSSAANRNPNTAAAAAAAAARTTTAPRVAVVPAAQRWFAHGSDSEDEEHLEASTSVALTPAQAAALAAS